MLPIVTTSTPVARVVTTMKISSLTRSTAVFLSRRLHRSDTSAPRAIGPTSSTPRSGRPRRSRRGPGRAATGAGGLLGAAGVAEPSAKLRSGATRLVPLPVGSSTPSSKFGWWRTGLAWVHGGFGRLQAVGAAVVAEPRHVAGRRTPRGWLRQRLEDDVQREAAERLGLELAGVDDAAR